jgi:hypothetical protein
MNIGLIWKAIACEVLARRIVHLASPDRMFVIMSSRFQHRQVDGDESEMSSALEMAIDSHWQVMNMVVNDIGLNSLFSAIFLSSSEAQEGNYIDLHLSPFAWLI